MVQAGGRLPHGDVDGLVVDEGVAHALADGLEGGDGPVKLLAVGGVLGGDAHGSLAGAGGDGAQADGGPIDDPVEHGGPVIEGADQASAPTRTPSKVIRYSASQLRVSSRSMVTPSASGSTTNTAGPRPGTVAGTSMASATWAKGTDVFSPERR